jgi:PKD repeat protein
MQKYIFSAVAFCAFFLIITVANAQMVTPNLTNVKSWTTSGSAILVGDAGLSAQPSLDPDLWMVTLQNLEAHHHPTIINKRDFKLLKEAATFRRSTSILPELKLGQKRSSVIDPPIIERNFRGNIRNGSVPMDNSMAVSTNGFIVSGINTNLFFSQPDGKVRFSSPLSDFFKILGLGLRMYDPRIIFDTEQNRFIIMCMYESEPNLSAMCIAFSETEDPTGEWTFYRIDGNPLNDRYWSDYPNVSISTEDLYISTLLRDTLGDWNYSMVFQISKKDGYAGKPLRWKYYADPKNADGKKAFNLVPTPNGWHTLVGPGMHFVSNEPLGGNTYNYYQTTGSIDSNPSLIAYQTTGIKTELAPNGRQKNSSEVLNTFDSRIWSALYLNGTIHMGSHVNTPQGDVGLFYGRFDIANLKVDATVLQMDEIDFGFPSFASFGMDENSDTILINNLYCGKNSFAGQQQRIVSGIGDQFEWSDPSLLKMGSGAIKVLSGGEQRWGDYSTACRRFFDDRSEAWTVGMHSEGVDYATWIGQLMPKRIVDTRPKAEFVADKTTIAKQKAIQFDDITPNNSRDWQWFFPGAQTPTSSLKNPIVNYANNGVFDVSLIVNTDLGFDTIVKKGFIHIQDLLLKPVANFTFDRDTIMAGDSVLFSSTSTGKIVNYKWTFSNGKPSTSRDSAQIVTYNFPGSYLVSLLVENNAGTNLKVKSKAIVVKPKSSATDNESQIESNLYPNPANQGSFLTIDFNIPTSQTLKFDVIDNNGKHIKTLFDGKIKSGQNRLQFESNLLSSGQYFIVINQGQLRKTLPLTIIQ